MVLSLLGSVAGAVFLYLRRVSAELATATERGDGDATALGGGGLGAPPSGPLRIRPAPGATDDVRPPEAFISASISRANETEISRDKAAPNASSTAAGGAANGAAATVDGDGARDDVWIARKGVSARESATATARPVRRIQSKKSIPEICFPARL